MSDERTRRIRDLNDRFRTTMSGGRVYVTGGIEALGEHVKGQVMAGVMVFDAFTDDHLGIGKKIAA